ncbi:MAG: M56 family metallopeptidase [Microcoleaceae cyanobacterium]
MHLLMLGIALTFAIAIQLIKSMHSTTQSTWTTRMQRSLIGIIAPPLLLIITAIAVICMGPQGKMLGQPTGQLGYGLAWVFCGWALIFAGILMWQALRSLRPIRCYPIQILHGIQVRVLDQPVLFCAQIGLWQPELVVSEGFIQTLTPQQQKAVLTHEQAHCYYRDTFCFFWLGWCRRLTAWLPQTETYWEELLLLRELRADRWAAEKVDPLLLAESLVLMVRHQAINSPDYCATFSAATPPNRLAERIEALLNDAEPFKVTYGEFWQWLGLILLPLWTIPLHHYF